MNSMTGFATLESAHHEFRLSCSLRSLNARFLEITLNLPPELEEKEQDLRNILKKHFHRGTISVSMRLQYADSQTDIVLNRARVASLLNQLQKLQEEYKAPFLHIGLSDLLKVEGVTLKPRERDRGVLFSQVEKDLHQLIVKVQTARELEGAKIRLDLQERIEKIQQVLRGITQRLPQVKEEAKEVLQAKYQEITSCNLLDKEAILKEVGFLLLKHDVHEEQKRLHYHTESFLQAINKSGPVGKHLDFLAQELNREIATLDSKANDLAIQDYAIQIKEFVDQIREQARNVE